MKTFPTADGTVIVETQIIGTKLFSVDAWTPCPVLENGRSDTSGFSTITTIEGAWYGRIGTERLPADLDALKGETRYSAVKVWQQAQYSRAYWAIIAAYQMPEGALGCSSSMGEITYHLA
jgi:hypothetical protein